MNFHSEGLPLIIQDFSVYLDIIKNKSSQTIEQYISDLVLFTRYMMIYKGKVADTSVFNEIEIDKIDEHFYRSITLDDTHHFLEWCKDCRGNREATRSRKVATLRSFYKYLTIVKKLLLKTLCPLSTLQN